MGTKSNESVPRSSSNSLQVPIMEEDSFDFAQFDEMQADSFSEDFSELDWSSLGGDSEEEKREEDREIFKTEFEKLDKNGDGVITLDECLPDIKEKYGYDFSRRALLK